MCSQVGVGPQTEEAAYVAHLASVGTADGSETVNEQPTSHGRHTHGLQSLQSQQSQQSQQTITRKEGWRMG